MLNKKNKDVIYTLAKLLLIIVLGVLSKYSFILMYIFVVIVSLMVSTLFHEINHFITFRIFGIKVTTVNIGVISISNKKISLSGSRIINGSCSFKYDSKIEKKNYYYALFAGGFYNLILGIIFLLFVLFIPTISFSTLKIIPIMILIFDGIFNLTYKNSTDRKIIRRIKNTK